MKIDNNAIQMLEFSLLHTQVRKHAPRVHCTMYDIRSPVVIESCDQWRANSRKEIETV